MPPSKGDAGNSADPPEDPRTSAEEDHDSLEALLRKVDPNMTVPGTWIVPHLLKLAKETKSKKIESLIQLFFDPETVNTRNLSPSRAKRLFNLREDDVPWELEEERYQVPKSLLGNLREHGTLWCDGESATRRIAVDFLLAACRLFLTRPVKGRVAWPPPMTRLPPGVFAELDLSVEITHPTSGQPIRVVGQANYGLGHGGRGALEDGSFMGAVEVERRMLFSLAEGPLLAHLAILRELNIQQRGTSPTVRGFYTDGERYTFVAIRNDGSIQQSVVYQLDFAEDEQPRLKTIFNFIIAILDTMSKDLPYTVPDYAGRDIDTDDWVPHGDDNGGLMYSG